MEDVVRLPPLESQAKNASDVVSATRKMVEQSTEQIASLKESREKYRRAALEMLRQLEEAKDCVKQTRPDPDLPGLRDIDWEDLTAKLQPTPPS